MTFADAVKGSGYKLATARGWLARGRRESEGEYAEFAAAVERARADHKLEAMTPAEHRQKVSEVARGGNVAALKLYWEMIRADEDADPNEDQAPADPLASLDELATRRRARTQ